MSRNTSATIVKLVIACFVVGLVLTAFNLDPQRVFAEAVRFAKHVANWSLSMFGSAMSYILLGAVVVLPVWLVLYLMRIIGGRR